MIIVQFCIGIVLYLLCGYVAAMAYKKLQKFIGRNALPDDMFLIIMCGPFAIVIGLLAGLVFLISWLSHKVK